ncbi:ABC transporter ATP-binding protein [Trichocoleus sp. DQ-U1]
MPIFGGLEAVATLAKKQVSALAKGSVEVKDLSVAFKRRDQYGPLLVLESTNFKINPGEFVCLLGPSGCGKSTILNLIAGFLKPTRGQVLVDEQPVERPGADRGFVFQQYSLLPWKTTFENVEFGLKIQGISRVERTELVNNYLDRVGLYKHRHSYPHQLSGGMQQRASIVRALVNSPSVLLMDEPFAALDAQTRHMMQELLLNIWSDLKSTVIFVTHDIEEAIFLSDRILVMGVRPGHIKETVVVNLDRPRHIDTMLSPDFVNLNRQVFELIREETLKSMELG